MIKPFVYFCTKVIPAVYDNSLSLYECICKIANKLNECIESTNNLSEAFENFVAWVKLEYVSKSDLKNTYKLDETGNFTGTIYKLPAYTVNDNKNKIDYLISQFSDGQTGLVIDGAFFESDKISKNYNGGVF